MRIISDRIASNTRIYDNNGNDITSSLGVYKIDLGIEVGAINTATLHCRGVDLDIVPSEVKKKRKLKLCWSCSDYVQHEHRYKWTAYLCGRLQLVKANLTDCFGFIWQRVD